MLFFIFYITHWLPVVYAFVYMTEDLTCGSYISSPPGEQFLQYRQNTCVCIPGHGLTPSQRASLRKGNTDMSSRFNW